MGTHGGCCQSSLASTNTTVPPQRLRLSTGSRKILSAVTLATGFVYETHPSSLGSTRTGLNEEESHRPPLSVLLSAHVHPPADGFYMRTFSVVGISDEVEHWKR